MNTNTTAQKFLYNFFSNFLLVNAMDYEFNLNPNSWIISVAKSRDVSTDPSSSSTKKRGAADESLLELVEDRRGLKRRSCGRSSSPLPISGWAFALLSFFFLLHWSLVHLACNNFRCVLLWFYNLSFELHVVLSSIVWLYLIIFLLSSFLLIFYHDLYISFE